MAVKVIGLAGNCQPFICPALATGVASFQRHRPIKTTGWFPVEPLKQSALLFSGSPVRFQASAAHTLATVLKIAP